MNNHPIRFTKMHGLGNDFVIIDAITQSIPIQTLPILQLADRHLGIGFDQLLIITTPPPQLKAAFFCYIFNADGSEAEQCGNGLRCVARFVQENHLYEQDEFKLATKAGIFAVNIKDHDHISMMMNVPRLIDHDLMLAGPKGTCIGPVTVLSLGNPHAILKVETIDNPSIPQLGKFISEQSVFPQGVNVGFMQIVNKQNIRLRTIERGSGETFACGSNAAAAAAAGMMQQQLTDCVEVEFYYGSLIIEWKGVGKPIKMTGPAIRVFEGSFII